MYDFFSVRFGGYIMVLFLIVVFFFFSFFRILLGGFSIFWYGIIIGCVCKFLFFMFIIGMRFLWEDNSIFSFILISIFILGYGNVLVFWSLSKFILLFGMWLIRVFVSFEGFFLLIFCLVISFILIVLL